MTRPFGSLNSAKTGSSWRLAVRTTFSGYGRCNRLTPTISRCKRSRVTRLARSRCRCCVRNLSRNGTTFISQIFSKSIGVQKIHPAITCYQSALTASSSSGTSTSTNLFRYCSTRIFFARRSSSSPPRKTTLHPAVLTKPSEYGT